MAKHLSPIDLSKNELQNARIQNLATPPSSPATGQIYYDTSLGAQCTWNGTIWVVDDVARVPNGYVPMAKLATDPLARANHTGQQAAASISDLATAILARSQHTGQQTAATISDFIAASQALINATRLNALTAPNADVAMGGFKVTGVATPVAGTDAATKQYVDDTVAGLSWKNEVRAATTGNAPLASAYANGATLDGVVLATGDRILLKDQTPASENGIYTVNVSGAPTRATDADTGEELCGCAVFVSNGTTNVSTRWVCNTPGVIVPGTTALAFVSFGVASVYTAGNGLALGGNTFSVTAAPSGGLVVGAPGVSVDTAIVVRKASFTIGDGVASSISVTHNLGTQDITLNVLDAVTRAMVQVDWTAPSVNVATITFASAPAANSFRVVVHG